MFLADFSVNYFYTKLVEPIFPVCLRWCNPEKAEKSARFIVKYTIAIQLENEHINFKKSHQIF